MLSGRQWVRGCLLSVCFCLFVLGTATVIIDPFFHYHAPLSGLQYPINNEQYQNDGIVRHFSYDAIITGTSMTENFKTSEFDQIFGVRSVKVPYSGERYRVINDNLKRAVKANGDIRIIVRSLDYSMLLRDKDERRSSVAYPDYLYDDCLWNDVSYVFNKEIFFNNTMGVISYTHSGGKTTSFDEYANWTAEHTFGREAVAAGYRRREQKAEVQAEFTEEDRERLEGNITQNITSLAEAHPEITFYLFFTPYSIYYWDSMNQDGELNRLLEGEKAAIELLLNYDNIHLYSFSDNFPLVCNLDNYMDIAHYSEEINTQILHWMHQGKYRLTRENYEAYCRRMREFYSTYDYEALFSFLL